jgi:hypothetical protein
MVTVIAASVSPPPRTAKRRELKALATPWRRTGDRDCPETDTARVADEAAGRQALDRVGFAGAQAKP